MTRFGHHLKTSIHHRHRAQVDQLFTEVFGCPSETPMPELQVFTMGERFSFGVFYVSDADALPDDLHPKATWLEFLVDDVDATRAALEALGIERVPYSDVTHSYHRIPGGPVFRLAPGG